MIDPDADGLPRGAEKRRAVRSMFDTIAPRYDLVNRIMTFGLDVRWRRRSMRELGVAPGSIVLDLAAGTGDFCREIEGRGSVAVGVDLSRGMLEAARTEAPLVHGDILRLPFPDGSVDAATCGFALRNLVELPGFFDELARVIRRGGRVALLDAAEPRNPLLRAGHRVYFGRVVPFIGGLLSDRSAYRYLPRSLAYLPSWDEMAQRLEQAGFTDTAQVGFIGARLLTATRSRGRAAK